MGGLPNSVMSAPAKKVLPSQRITTAFTPSSSAACLIAASNPSRTAAPRAFTGGLSETMTSTSPSLWVVTTDIGGSPDGAGAGGRNDVPGFLNRRRRTIQTVVEPDRIGHAGAMTSGAPAAEVDAAPVDARTTPRFERKRELILDAATALINQRGLKGMTFVEVAQAVKLNTPSVTYYFRLKEQLAAAVYARTLDRLEALVAEAVQAPDPRAPRRPATSS